MKVAIVCSFDTYEQRVNMIYDFFESMGADVKVIVSDFCHFKKVYRNEVENNYILVHAKEYRKNLSIARMKSHYFFSKDAIKEVEKIRPELLYVLLPANSLVKDAAVYKEHNKNVKLIFDVIDLWPETMTIGSIKKVFPFTYWRNLRDKYIGKADHIITECDLFADKLKDVVGNNRMTTLYFAADKLSDQIETKRIIDADKIRLCYLGSINNVIDIDFITAIIRKIDKKVELHIIGDGENRDLFIEQVKNAGADVKYYGKIYDDIGKASILCNCHYGLNIMKSTVCVGLTMKSVEYFRYGLPILNNIKGDTWNIVRDRNVGINVDLDENDLRNLSDKSNYNRENVKKCFEELLSKERFFDKLKEVICNISR